MSLSGHCKWHYDASLSFSPRRQYLTPETANFLRSHGFDVKSLLEDGLGDLDDDEVANIASKEKRIIITFDLDFGEMQYFASKKKFGVIILRLSDQRVEVVNKVLLNFFDHYYHIFGKEWRLLAILAETEVRISH